MVNKVAGNFHIALGSKAYQEQQQMTTQHMHRFTMQELDKFNSSHIIHHLSFGDALPQIKNPLDGEKHTVFGGNIAQYKYYIQIVPTSYEKGNGNSIKSNQYSVSRYAKEIKRGASSFPQPGAFFFYDIAPIRAHMEESSKPFVHFITELCAILGGIFVVSGIIHSFVIILLKQLNIKNTQ